MVFQFFGEKMLDFPVLLPHSKRKRISGGRFVKELTIGRNDAGQRLDRFLA